MHCVYILRSQTNTDKVYIGYTEDLARRLREHGNASPDAHTRRYAPWILETYIVFSSKKVGQDFELYLKSHSGRAFLRRKLMAVE